MELKKINNFEDYLISEEGKVYSTKEGFLREISLSIDRYGYYRCCLYNGTKHTIRVHRLVAEAFIPNPHKKLLVNHIDSNRLNNNVANLEWVNYTENNRHAVEFGNHNLNFCVTQFLDGIWINTFKSTHEASRKTGISQSSIVKVCKGKRKSAGGFQWNYI